MLQIFLTALSEATSPKQRPIAFPAYLDESDLCQRAATGDVKAFSVLVERYQDTIYRLCRRYLSPADSEDAAQETFVRAFLHQGQFDPGRPLKPWLATVARRICIDQQRRYAVRKHEDLDTVQLSGNADTEAHLSQHQDMAMLLNCLKTLPDSQREALFLYYQEEMSYTEIATALEVPMGTVMTWLHRGKAKLLQAMQSADNTEESNKEQR